MYNKLLKHKKNDKSEYKKLAKYSYKKNISIEYYENINKFIESVNKEDTVIIYK